LQRLLEMPKRARMDNLLIVSESNNGKTTLVSQFQKRHGEPFVNHDNEAIKPIVIVESPPAADEKSLHLSILKRFRAPFRKTAPAAELRYQAIHLLRQCRARMLIIDEFHSLLAGTGRNQSVVMNTVKLLCNELQIPIVAVGTHEAVQVLRTDPQHVSRFDVARLPLWKLDRDFQRLLVGFEQILPLKRPSNLYRKEMAQLLYTFCGGNLGDLRKLLVNCAREAIETGAEHIGTELVEKTHARAVASRGADDKR
ncbi:MAG: TniB family NTP-binding protein, partial [Acidobacteria bacterium]|nr:TniB family NTP-binding protein [Acidobacteriota bacterium]